MYLILNIEEALIRNRKAAVDVGWNVPDGQRWSYIIHGEECALDVEDGEGLTEIEIEQCVQQLPFNIEEQYNGLGSNNL